MTSTDSGLAAASPLSALAALSGELAGVVARVGAATVAVRTEAPRHGHGARGSGVASGLVWRPGIVVTTAHGFRRTPAAVSLVLEGAAELAATLVGLDTSTDLAVFRIGDAQALPSAEIGSADTLCAGHLAVAVARSARGDLSGSFGMVHRAAGAWQTWLGGQLERRIELDGGLHEGESGGPVADAHGRVVGIASPALSRRHAIVVPAGTVSKVVDALLAKGHVARAFLGIGAQAVDLGHGEGLLINALATAGPALQAGLLVGDIVLSVAGQPVPSLAALRVALADRVGETVPVAFSRGGVASQASITVGQWPLEARRC